MTKILSMSLALLLTVLIAGCFCSPQVLPTNVDCGKVEPIAMTAPKTILELAEAYNKSVDTAGKEYRIIKCYEKVLGK